jgi:phosphohistidine phosphatase
MEEYKYIYLCRHAKSDWEAEFRIDHERPISQRGKKNAKQLREFLEEKKIQFDISYISDSKRTLETYAILKKNIELFKEVIITSQVYESNFATFFNLIENTEDSKQSILFLGHNPELEEFANHLILKQNSIPDISFFHKFATSSILSLAIECNSWKDIKSNRAKIVFFWTPTKS